MSETESYRPRHVSRSEFIEVRGLSCHLRLWGDPSAPPLVLLHGTRDMSASYQFVIDCFKRAYFIVAPDWRGHGQSGFNPQGYWFQDYLADLDAILDRMFPGRPIPLVGHSLGGNVASIFAGVRPTRVSKLIALDGFGLTEEPVEHTPDQLRNWLDGWHQPPGTGTPYMQLSDMAARLMKANPRLTPARASFLAPHMARQVEGGYVWSFDPLHRLPFAMRHRRAEWAACMQRIEAPTLWVASGRRSRFEAEPGGIEARMALIRDISFTQVPDTSHNLHHDNPQRVAELIENFLEGHRPS